MASSNAQVGVAKSAYYPLVNLTADGGFESGVITTLVSGPSVLWSIGASAAAPIFDAGRRRAGPDQALAAYDETVDDYRQTVLTGFQQVEENLAALRILEQEAVTQQRAVVASRKSLDLSLIRYRGGITSYPEVTIAQSADLADEVTAVDILGRRLSSESS
jgi:outer membrane protein TolC